MNKALILLALIAVCLAMEGVVELKDENWASVVQSQPKYWLVMFSASWCGHCTHLKPQIQKLAPLLAELGVSVGHVDENNKDLVDRFVVDHKTHMLSYPKLYVFLGEQNKGQVPGSLRNAHGLLNYVKENFLKQQEWTEDL